MSEESKIQGVVVQAVAAEEDPRFQVQHRSIRCHPSARAVSPGLCQQCWHLELRHLRGLPWESSTGHCPDQTSCSEQHQLQQYSQGQIQLGLGYLQQYLGTPQPIWPSCSDIWSPSQSKRLKGFPVFQQVHCLSSCAWTLLGRAGICCTQSHHPGHW